MTTVNWLSKRVPPVVIDIANVVMRVITAGNQDILLGIVKDLVEDMIAAEDAILDLGVEIAAEADLGTEGGILEIGIEVNMIGVEIVIVATNLNVIIVAGKAISREIAQNPIKERRAGAVEETKNASIAIKWAI